jgi:uncharacterized protein YjcR
MRGNIDWIAIKNEYITGAVTYKVLAAKHGISEQNLRHRAGREKWSDDKRTLATHIAQKSVCKAVEKAVKRNSDILAKEFRLADNITKIIENAIKDPKQFNKHLITRKEGEYQGSSSQWVEVQEFDVLDTKRLKDITDTLATNTALKRLIKGILDVKDEKRLKLDRERLELDKTRLDVSADEDSDEQGVVYLPQTDESLTDDAVIEEVKTIDTGRVVDDYE